MGLFDALNNDPYKPTVLNQSLAQWDNYQIYTLVCRDILFSTEYTQYISPYDNSVNFDSYVCNTLRELQITGYYYSPHATLWQVDEFGNYVQLSTPVHSQQSPTTSQFNDWLAIQSFSPSPIKIDFLTYVNNYSEIDTSPLVTHTYGATNTVASNIHKYNSNGSVTTEWLELTGNSGSFPDFYPGSYSRKITGYEAFDPGTNFGVQQATRYRWLVSFFEKIINSPPPPFNKPSYMDLLKGYTHDSRSVPSKPKVIPNYSGKLSIGYYREANEPIPSLRSIGWFNYTIDVIKDKPIYLPITDCVLGTLWLSNLEIENQIKLKPTLLGWYSYRSLFKEGVSDLFAQWEIIYQNSRNRPTLSGTILQTDIYHQISKRINILGANNNVWNNGQAVQDIGLDLNHPMFVLNAERTFQYHFTPQLDESFGDLTMDSPRVLEIREIVNKLSIALDAEKFSTNELNPDATRVTTLGWHINRQSDVLGIRAEADGTLNHAKEKQKIKQVVQGKSPIDASKIGVNNFGDEGMILARINNRFQAGEIVNDERVIVKDMIQLITECHEQSNRALNIQESSAVEINTGAGKAKYNNQLEMMIELVSIVHDVQQMIRSTMISSLVTQGQTTEIIGGLGLPSVTKTMVLNIDGKNKDLPYKGISAHRSISQEIATCAYNIGAVTGQLI